VLPDTSDAAVVEDTAVLADLHESAVLSAGLFTGVREGARGAGVGASAAGDMVARVAGLAGGTTPLVTAADWAGGATPFPDIFARVEGGEVEGGKQERRGREVTARRR
jgi:hypothetical protein